jgi:uncharacterized protein YfeS
MPCFKARARLARAVEEQHEPPIDDAGPDPLDPASAHPVARSLMLDPWFWSIADDGSPLGNDTGADTLAAFREWRPTHTVVDPLALLRQLLRGWQVPDRDWRLLEPAALEHALPRRHYAILTRDDTAIALAFAQLVEEGRVSRMVRDRALLAVRRQSLPVVIAFRGWVDPAERKERLARMESVLNQCAGRTTSGCS